MAAILNSVDGRRHEMSGDIQVGSGRKYGGRHRIRVSSGSAGQVRGGGGLQSCTTPPPLFALQNLSRCPRDNNKIINVGEKTWLCLQAMTVAKHVSGFVNKLSKPKS